jgi:protein-arginine kinase activator protein McsA
MMATEINLNNSEEFQEMIERKDFTIAKAVVETILANLNGRKKHVHVLSVNCLEDGATYDITLERKYFAETLQENLKYYIEKELYEECSQIVEAINKLKEKEDNGSKNTNTNTKPKAKT